MRLVERERGDEYRHGGDARSESAAQHLESARESAGPRHDYCDMGKGQACDDRDRRGVGRERTKLRKRRMHGYFLSTVVSAVKYIKGDSDCILLRLRGAIFLKPQYKCILTKGVESLFSLKWGMRRRFSTGDNALAPHRRGPWPCPSTQREPIKRQRKGDRFMPSSALARRSFLAAGAAAGAAVAFGGVGGRRPEAFAWGEDLVVGYAATTCDGCGNKCGMGLGRGTAPCGASWDSRTIRSRMGICACAA